MSEQLRRRRRHLERALKRLDRARLNLGKVALTFHQDESRELLEAFDVLTETRERLNVARALLAGLTPEATR
jgi:hypothetical protein